MPTPRLIGPLGGATPTEFQTRPGRARRIPADLLRQVSRRLQIMSLVAAALWLLGPLLGHFARRRLTPSDTRWAHLMLPDWIALGSMVLSLAIYFYLRRRDQDPNRVMDLGLIFMVLSCFTLGVMMHAGPLSGTAAGLTPTITWIGPVMLIFAAIVPVAPWKMLAAGLVAASMDPAGMLVDRAAGYYHFDSAADAVLMHFPNFLMLGVAVVISSVVTRLGQQVAKEREMGSYSLGPILSRGGMGEVYQATHRMLARPAAIKLIRPDAGDPQGEAAELAAARFHREARAAANLRSPHTVELYDFGVTEDQTLYLVMELLDGLDLETLVREHGPVAPARAVHLLTQACESLEEAHASGLIHRDIKPANIHVGRVGLRYDFVKVLDFGLVKSIEGAPEDSLATAAGLTPGTPAYLAPEMVAGGVVDGRADLYSLGCVAYYLLTGTLVFPAENALQMIARHISVAPQPPSERAGVALPPALDRLVLTCLAKDPADRPATAGQLAKALAALDLPPWREEDAARWWGERAGS